MFLYKDSFSCIDSFNQLNTSFFNSNFLSSSQFFFSSLNSLYFVLSYNMHLKHQIQPLTLGTYQEWRRVRFRPGFFISGPNPWVKISGPDQARLLSGFFSPSPDLPLPEPTGLTDPVKGLSPISGPTKKKKKRIEAQIYFCHIQPQYSNSILDNVAQMPKPNEKRKKKKKELKPKFTYHHQQQQFLDSLSSQQKNTSLLYFFISKFSLFFFNPRKLQEWSVGLWISH